MVQAKTCDDNANVRIKFYAVPENMKEQLSKDPDLLLKSSDISLLYSANERDYVSNTESHNKNAENAFDSFQDNYNKRMQCLVR